MRRIKGRQIVLVFLLLAGSVLLAAMAFVLYNEHVISADAETAKSDLTGVTPHNRMWKELQPAGSESTDNAWDHFRLAREIVDKLNGEIWDNPNGHKDAEGKNIKPDYTAIGEPDPPGLSGESLHARAVGTATAKEMMERLKRTRVFEQFREIAAAPRRDMVLDLPPGQPAISQLLPELKELRELARINKARMTEAIEVGAANDFKQELKEVLAFSGMAAENPTFLARLVAVALEDIAIKTSMRAIRAHPDSQWLDAIESAWREARPHPPRSYAMTAEKATAMDTLAWTFTQTAVIRQRRWESMLGKLKDGFSLGRYDDNRTALAGYFTVFIQQADRERWNRNLPSETTSRLFFTNILATPMEKALCAFDAMELSKGGITVMIALERYRIANGHFPDTLDQLVPAQLSRLPLDPWSGKPVCFRQLAPESDPQRRQYLLWGVGNDGVDNGGVFAGRGKEFHAVSNVLEPGIDFILNDFER